MRASIKCETFKDIFSMSYSLFPTKCDRYIPRRRKHAKQ